MAPRYSRGVFVDDVTGAGHHQVPPVGGARGDTGLLTGRNQRVLTLDVQQRALDRVHNGPVVAATPFGRDLVQRRQFRDQAIAVGALRSSRRSSRLASRRTRAPRRASRTAPAMTRSAPSTGRPFVRADPARSPRSPRPAPATGTSPRTPTRATRPSNARSPRQASRRASARAPRHRPRTARFPMDRCANHARDRPRRDRKPDHMVRANAPPVTRYGPGSSARAAGRSAVLDRRT